MPDQGHSGRDRWTLETANSVLLAGSAQTLPRQISVSLATDMRVHHLNHLDPHICTAFAFIGITDIAFIGVNYDEFPDDRFTRSLATAEAAIIQFAHEQAEIWSGQVTSICAVAVR